ADFYIRTPIVSGALYVSLRATRPLPSSQLYESARWALPTGMAHSAFVPLRIFSSYTMLDGAIEPKAIAKRAQELGFPAAALTDRNGLYAAMAF
uniref:PHP domain-containing protein n=1 Tax=Salmonella sp. E404 TaxID=3240325 RepID=UPI00352BB853